MLKRLKSFLAPYSVKKKLNKTLVATRVLELWPQTLEEEGLGAYKEKARALSYRDRGITVEVAGPSLAGEIRMKEEDLLACLNRHFGQTVVDRIYWRVL